MNARLDGEPLPERIADAIVDAIARGRIQSMERLGEAELARELGLSRIPLREAFRILHSQGIVVTTPHRGTRAIYFGKRWMEDARALRFGVERVAALRTAERLRAFPDDAVRLDDAAAAIARALEGGDLHAVNAADIAFHGEVAALALSPIVTAMWNAARRHIAILFSIDVRAMDDPGRILLDHLDLRDAILRGEPEGVENAVWRHVFWRGDGGPRDAGNSR